MQDDAMTGGNSSQDPLPDTVIMRSTQLQPTNLGNHSVLNPQRSLSPSASKLPVHKDGKAVVLSSRNQGQTPLDGRTVTVTNSVIIGAGSSAVDDGGEGAEEIQGMHHMAQSQDTVVMVPSGMDMNATNRNNKAAVSTANLDEELQKNNNLH